MKNILITGLLLCFIATACRKSDDSSIFGKKPEERINETLSTYKKQLAGSTDGWKAYLFAANGSGYGFYFKFTDNGRITMMGDFTSQTGSEPFESSYRMEAVQRPSIFFDTYNYLHLLADPDPDISGGPQGIGLGADYEFGFDSTHTDTVFLTGNQFKSRLLLIKASKADADQYTAGRLNDVQSEVDNYVASTSSLSIKSPDGKNAQLLINTPGRRLSLLMEDKGVVTVAPHAYAYGLHSIFLDTVVTVGSLHFQEIFFDNTASQLYVMNNGARINLESSSQPIFALDKLMGISYSGFTARSATAVAFSASFNAHYKSAQAAIAALPYSIVLSRIDVTFDINAEKMKLNYILARGATLFQAPYDYSYVKRADGSYKFIQDELTGSNSTLIQDALAPISAKLQKDRFRLDYLFIPGTPLMGQLISVEDPAYYFGGILR